MEVRPWDPENYAPGRVSRIRCTWGGNGPDDPCTGEMKYTVIDGNGARWSSCEAHWTAYQNSLR